MMEKRICSVFTQKRASRHTLEPELLSTAFIANFGPILPLFLVFLLMTLNK